MTMTMVTSEQPMFYVLEVLLKEGRDLVIRDACGELQRLVNLVVHICRIKATQNEACIDLHSGDFVT